MIFTLIFLKKKFCLLKYKHFFFFNEKIINIFIMYFFFKKKIIGGNEINNNNHGNYHMPRLVLTSMIVIPKENSKELLHQHNQMVHVAYMKIYHSKFLLPFY